MEQTNNKELYEWLKKEVIKFHDALTNIFGNYELGITRSGHIYLYSEPGTMYVFNTKSKESNDLCFTYQDLYKYDIFKLSLVDNGIISNELKINTHTKGFNVETVERVYGKSRYDQNKNALLDLKSTNYVLKDYESIVKLMNTDYLQKNTLLTTTFSAHMKYFGKMPRESRSITAMYPSHVYFNGEDISHIYEFVDGIDKISRIYDLYSGNVMKESEDINIILTGIADNNSFNFKYRNIGKEIQSLIGEPVDINTQIKIVEEYIKAQLGSQTENNNERKIELKDFNSFKELISTPVNENERVQVLEFMNEIYNTSLQNQVWIGMIIDFLNDNNEGKYYNEYYLTPEGSYGTRKYTYRFISTENDMRTLKSVAATISK